MQSQQKTNQMTVMFFQSQLSSVKCQKRGISLLEVLIVIAIIALLGSAGVASYRNTVKGVEFSMVAKMIIADLRHAQAKAMAGENNVKWGIHAVNNADDYYEFFSTPTNYADASKVVSATTTLSRGIVFSDPGESVNKDIIFSKVGGTTTPMTLGISFEGQVTTITVTAQGAVY